MNHGLHAKLMNKFSVAYSHVFIVRIILKENRFKTNWMKFNWPKAKHTEYQEKLMQAHKWMNETKKKKKNINNNNSLE